MKRERIKACAACKTEATTLYRCQLDASKQWHLICKVCWDRLSPDNPHYRYGGTWKAVKRH
jgi:hypothetical protein